MAKEKQEKKRNNSNILANPEERKKFKTALAMITQYFSQVDDLKESVKETITELSANTGLDKKTIRKLATTMYKHNYGTLQEENKHFELLYETIIEGRIQAIKDPVARKEAQEELEEEAA